ncbi:MULTISPECIES: hypothetical protein [Calothrix]|uniref:Uncharacterized protein n=2 Tax=Calothrix TaxID=1186 RepID=A0ABR8AK39_9CYAN|nr:MULTISPECIES: hypothetical protein [Calothrix]MBD2200338.1 hypothetical protein [Calothrix parietina FACHB-288]MBD2228962.1 hypothetical protein [Calothrix anomala FACHB-343]
MRKSHNQVWKSFLAPSFLIKITGNLGALQKLDPRISDRPTSTIWHNLIFAVPGV